MKAIKVFIHPVRAPSSLSCSCPKENISQRFPNYFCPRKGWNAPGGSSPSQPSKRDGDSLGALGWCGGKEDTEQQRDCSGVTRMEDEVPKGSTHRGMKGFGSCCGSSLNICFSCPLLGLQFAPRTFVLERQELWGTGKGWGGTGVPGGVGGFHGMSDPRCIQTFGLLEDVQDVGTGDSPGLSKGQGGPAAHPVPVRRAAWGGRGQR